MKSDRTSDSVTAESISERLTVAERAAIAGESEVVDEILCRILPVLGAERDSTLRARVMLIKAKLLRATDGLRPARQALDEIADQYPLDYPIAFERAQVTAAQGDWTQAIEYAQRAVELASTTDPPSRPAAEALLGQTLLKGGRTKEALGSLDGAIHGGVQDANVYEARARARFLTAQYQGAIDDFQRAFDLDLPKRTSSLLLISRAFEALGAPDQAIPWAKSIIENEPDTASWARPYLGYLYVVSKRYKDALAEFKHTDLNAIPTWLPPLIVPAMAVALHSLGKMTEAIPALESARQLFPRRLDLEARLLDAYVGQNRIDQALRLYLDVQRRDPGLIRQGVGQVMAARLSHAIAEVEELPRGPKGEIEGAIFITDGDDGPGYTVYRSLKDVPEMFDESYRAAFGLGVPTEHKVEFLTRLARQLRATNDHAAAADLLEMAIAELRAHKAVRTIWDEALIDIIDRCSAIWAEIPRRYQHALLQNEANLAAAIAVGSGDLTPFANEFFRIFELFVDERLIRPIQSRFPSLGLRPANTTLSVTSLYHRLRQPLIREPLLDLIPRQLLDQFSQLLEGILDLRVSTHGWLGANIDHLRNSLLGHDNLPGLLALSIDIAKRIQT